MRNGCEEVNKKIETCLLKLPERNVMNWICFDKELFSVGFDI